MFDCNMFLKDDDDDDDDDGKRMKRGMELTYHLRGEEEKV